MDTSKTLLSRFMDALTWAANRHVRIIVQRDDIKMTVYFDCHHKVSSIAVMSAFIDAVEEAKLNPDTRKAEELPSPPAVSYEDVEEILK